MKYDVLVLAYSVMSNHVHLIIQATEFIPFIRFLRVSYTRTFNSIYKRNGCFGDPRFYSIELKGHRHIVAAISYVLRNPAHHKVSVNPFSYPYSSIDLYFRSGFLQLPTKISGDGCIKSRRLIERHLRVEERVHFDGKGMMDPQCFVETGMVENFYGSYASFNYHISRKDFLKWKSEQLEEDPSIDCISLRNMEPFLSPDSAQNLETYLNRKSEERTMSDLKICALIDEVYLPRFRKTSYVQLTDAQCNVIIREMKSRYLLSHSQISRCLGRR